ncbi:MAG TPA: hypothetical protein VEH82_01170, partial [Acidimicrobiales bacterium]|nr:hypothetical protein [Acidimicrobiales bacterium]
DVGRRPSIGAVRRSKQTAAAEPAPAGRTQSPETAPTPAAPPPVAPPGAPAPAATTGPARAVDRDSLTEAWGDGILQSLPARAKARYASGRFVAVDEQGAHFALPNAAHRDQCTEHQGLVEAALAAHFGTEVGLVLVVDEAATPPARPNGQPAPAAARSAVQPSEDGVPPPDDADEIDPGEFVAAGSAAEETAAAEARLLEAFPGASEVVG